MGVRIAIDDFGTGYSNLAYLRRLPVHALKLAGSFVTGATARRHRRTTTSRSSMLLIRLAHTLGLTVTAESVETAGQLRAAARARLRHRAGLVSSRPRRCRRQRSPSCWPPRSTPRSSRSRRRGPAASATGWWSTSAGLLLHRPGTAGPEVLLGHMGGPFWARKDDGRLVDPQGRTRPGRRPARRGGPRVHRGAGRRRRPPARRCRWAPCASRAASGSPSSRWPATSTPAQSSAGTFTWSGRPARAGCGVPGDRPRRLVRARRGPARRRPRSGALPRPAHRPARRPGLSGADSGYARS